MKKHYKKSEINLNKKKKKPSFYASVLDFSLSLIHEEKVMLVAIASAVLFLSFLLIESAQLSKSLAAQANAKKQKDRITYELSFWQQVITSHPDYRDAYFMVAVLDYRLGNKQSSREYLEKAMKIDPNFEKGKELQELLTK